MGSIMLSEAAQYAFVADTPATWLAILIVAALGIWLIYDGVSTIERVFIKAQETLSQDDTKQIAQAIKKQIEHLKSKGGWSKPSNEDAKKMVVDLMNDDGLKCQLAITHAYQQNKREAITVDFS